MIKKILNLVKKVTVAIAILYGFNLLLQNVSIFIPINIPTIASVTFLGIPGFLSMLVMFFLTK